MKLLRAVARHAFLIGFIVILVVGYYYRASLFPGTFGPKEEKVAESAPVVAAPAVPEPAAEAGEPARADAQPEASAAPAPQDEAKPSQAPAAPPAVPSGAPQAEAPAPESAGASAAAEAAQALGAARQAYWRKDIEAAEKEYRRLAELEPGSPDPYGELGNVYFNEGNWKAAAEAYAEAANRLIDAGRRGQAAYLVQVIHGLDEESASELEQRLNEAPAPSE